MSAGPDTVEHMFEVAVDAAPVGAATFRAWRDALAGLDREVDDAERVDQIRALEELKAAAAAAQARAAADLHASVRARHAAAGIPVDQQGKGVGAQVALARRESPHRGGRHLGLALALTAEMPHTLSALSAGRLTEWRATLLVRETAVLSREDRARVDRELAADPRILDGVGDRGLVARARAAAYRLDPEAAVRRVRKAEIERQVTLRPAPDTMSFLTGLLPAAQGVAAYAALCRAADAARAAGDPRSRSQVMADTLVERVTGQATAAAVPVTVGLVMTAGSLFAGDREPARLVGYGSVPAGWARDLVRTASTLGDGAATLRRLFTHPSTGELVAMESRSRIFPASLRDLLVARDETCRTPWCDAPIRHADHVVGHADFGPTSAGNGQGLCEACNHTKQAPGWRARPGPGGAPGRHTVVTTTPTGHRYISRPRPLPGGPAAPQSPAERQLETVLAEYAA